MPLSNKTLETICTIFFGIILLSGFIKSIYYRSGERPSDKQPAGDDLYENDFINQERPHYFE